MARWTAHGRLPHRGESWPPAPEASPSPGPWRTRHRHPSLPGDPGDESRGPSGSTPGPGCPGPGSPLAPGSPASAFSMDLLRMAFLKCLKWWQDCPHAGTRPLSHPLSLSLNVSGTKRKRGGEWGGFSPSHSPKARRVRGTGRWGVARTEGGGEGPREGGEAHGAPLPHLPGVVGGCLCHR